MHPLASPSAHPLVARDDPTTPMPRTLLDARGGFAWWYVDLVDEAGNGVVVIWSFGLPFLPGYASASRAGKGERAGDRPSLNVAVYVRGELAAYVLEEPGVRGLYLASGSAHPGGGVPLCLQSGRAAAAALLEDLGLSA